MTELETHLLEALKTLQDEQEKRNNDLMTLWNERESALTQQISRLRQQVSSLTTQLEQQNSDNQKLANALTSLHQRLNELAES